MKLKGGIDVTHLGLRGRLYVSRHGTLAPAAPPTGAKQPDAAKVTDGLHEAPPSYVLLHGIGVSHRYLARLHLELAKTGNVYSFDLPGFGAAPKPGEQLQVSQYADFVAAVLTDAGGPDPQGYVMVGHSMGTQFAAELAVRYPRMVSGVVLMSPVVDPQRGTVLQQTADLTRDSLFCESPTANATVFTDYLRAGPRWYLTELPVMMAYPLLETVQQIQQPVLVVRGSRDPVARAPWCRKLAETAPHGTLVEVPGKGHVVQHTGTGAVAAAISRWAHPVEVRPDPSGPVGS